MATSIQRKCPCHYGHGLLALGAICWENPMQLPAVKTIREASTIGGMSLEANMLFCWQAEAPKKLPSRPSNQEQMNLLPRPFASRSSLPMEGRLREVLGEWMGVTQDPFMLGTIQGHLLWFNQKPHTVKPTLQVQGKDLKDSEEHDGFRHWIDAVWGHHRCWVRNKEFFTYPFLIPKRNGEASLLWTSSCWTNS